jgi:predicted glycoside hydrolase/deacetylase ChbG (UPF0249 family)
LAPETEDAIELIRSNGLKQIGIHTMLLPWTKDIRPKRQDYVDLFRNSTFQEIEKLALEELNKFEKLVDRKPTHICPQYGLHGNLKLLKLIIKYAVENNIPVRLPLSTLEGDEIPDQNYAAEIMMRRSGVRTTSHLFAQILGSDLTIIKDELLKNLASVKPGESTEILLHPGFFDLDLLKYSSLRYERPRDIALSQDADFKKEIINMDFEIVDYSKI